MFLTSMGKGKARRGVSGWTGWCGTLRRGGGRREGKESYEGGGGGGLGFGMTKLVYAAHILFIDYYF